MTAPEQSDDLQLLCMLNNIGATEPNRSLDIQQISEWTKLEISQLHLLLQKLIALGYVHSLQMEETSKYHLTIDGIRKVLSLYS
jgi:DNA-binding IclR family transcriptional regulator